MLAASVSLADLLLGKGSQTSVQTINSVTQIKLNAPITHGMLHPSLRVPLRNVPASIILIFLRVRLFVFSVIAVAATVLLSVWLTSHFCICAFVVFVMQTAKEPQALGWCVTPEQQVILLDYLRSCDHNIPCMMTAFVIKDTPVAH